MRFLETLLLVFALIYVAQLIIAALILATLMLFLWCLWKRPKEALVLGLALLLVVFISKPIGLVLVLMVAVGLITWTVVCSIKSRRHRGSRAPIALLPKN